MFTKNVAKLSDGVDIAYTDSGPVPGSTNYTTLIIIHGSGFDWSTFEKLHDYAPNYNFRTIVMQRREYPGSTNYTDEELNDIKTGQKAHIDQAAITLALFCQHVIVEHAIAPIGGDGKSGGIAIMGWSFGATYAMSIFADSTVINPEVKVQLEKYVKILVLYDPPSACYGYEIPADAKYYDAWNHCGLTGEAQKLHYTRWIATYFDVPSGWLGDISSLDHRPSTERSTMDSWTPDEQKKMFLAEPVFRYEWYMFFGPMQTTLRNETHSVLFDENSVKSNFSSASVILLNPDKSIWQCIWGCWLIAKQYEEHKGRGEIIRPMNIIPMRNRNHFVHYDYPDEFLGVLQNQFTLN